MRVVTRNVAIAVGVLCALAALPVALAPAGGWGATLLIAVAGAALTGVYVHRRLVRPWEEAVQAAGLPDGRDSVPADELARTLVSEYRSALQTIEEASSATHQQKSALAHTSDGVVLIGADGYVEYANPVARWLVHDRVLDVSRRVSPPELERLVSRAVSGRAPTTGELVLRLPEPRHVAARAIPLEDASCVLLFQDRTEARRLDRMRRDFVANVSHELKTPATSIGALADVARSALGDNDLDGASRFIERLEVEAGRLSSLVSDLLDLSKVEAVGGDHERRVVALRDLLEASAERARPLGEAKGVRIEVAGPPVTVSADPAQLSMAVHNLVDNAVRYSDGGTVRLTVAPAGDEATIAVSDEGIGIPTSELSRIFERFYRVDRARSRATGGTGLGLSIVRHIAENHGGRVEVRSELGEGSTFMLHLSAASNPAGDAA